MKINKFILAAALGLGVAGSNYAGDVYLTGSTACRGVVYNTLAAANSVFGAAPTITTWGSTSASGANYMDFSGTLNGGSGTTVIHCSWSGSEAGIANVASGTTALFSTDPDGTGLTNAGPASTASYRVDLAMADNDQAFSRTPKPALTIGQKVCVITFEWVRNNGIWQGTNVTGNQIQAALGGLCKLALFDGIAADTNSYVYVSGRDNSSGTRVNAFGISGFGIFSSPAQVELDGSGDMLQASDGGYAEDWGFSSGGNLAKSLGGSTVGKTDYVNYYQTTPPYAFIPNNAGYSVIAYLGYNDALTAIGSPYNATALNYNGVPFSAANVQEGTYTFWGNEYIYQSPAYTGQSTDVGSVYSGIGNNIANWCYPNNGANPNGIALSAMHCARSGPLSAPGHN